MFSAVRCCAARTGSKSRRWERPPASISVRGKRCGGCSTSSKAGVSWPGSLPARTFSPRWSACPSAQDRRRSPGVSPSSTSCAHGRAASRRSSCWGWRREASRAGPTHRPSSTTTHAAASTSARARGFCARTPYHASATSSTRPAQGRPGASISCGRRRPTRGRPGWRARSGTRLACSSTPGKSPAGRGGGRSRP